MAKDAASAAKKWSQNLASATQAITDGVNAVQQSPTAAAAAQQNVMLNNLQQAVNSGKWAAGLNRVSTQDWKNSMVQKGIPRIASGAQAAQPKMQQFLGQLIPHVAGVVASLPPRGTPEQNEQRALAMMRGMRQFKRS